MLCSVDFLSLIMSSPWIITIFLPEEQTQFTIIISVSGKNLVTVFSNFNSNVGLINLKRIGNKKN